MTTHVQPLPDRLLVGSHGRPDLSSHGVSDEHLRGPLWIRSNQGLWCWSSATDSPDERILRAAPLAQGRGALGGWAAARVLGAPFMDGTRWDGESHPVLLCLPRSARCRRIRDVRVFRSDLEEHEIVEVDGVPVTSVLRTCVDLARLVRPWRDAVAAVDSLLTVHPHVVPEAWQWLDEHPRWTGVSQARRVLALAAPGVASPQETALRLLWVVDAGLPTPRVNARVLHTSGHLLGIGDLVDGDAGLVGEFDGGHHATAEQRSVDHSRREGFEDAGLIVVQHTSADLGPARTRAVARLRARYAQGLRRDRSRDRWRVA